MAIDDNTSYELTGAQVKDLASKINAKEDSADLAAVAESGSYNDLSDKPTIGNATLTIQKNGTSAGTFTANATSNKTINITVPTTAADVSALPASTKYGASIAVSINTTDYKVTTALKDQDGNTLGTAQVIDLPLESVVVNGSYDNTNKKIVLTLQNGSTIDIPVADLVAGLQTEITSTNKLSSDLVDDTNHTHKFVTAAQITKLNGIATGAEVNQNAFSNVKVGSTTVSADTKTDTLELVAGSNVTLTPDATNDKVTIAATDTTYSDATTSTHGLMSAADKTKLDGIATGAEVNVQANWTQTTTTADDYIKNKPNLAAVATSGSYTDLSDKPTIPTVNNGTLTIKKNGTDVQTFTANQSENATANITVPTKVSDLTSDAGGNIFVGTCSTAAATATKAVIVSTDQNFALKAGAVVAVKFTYTNTASTPKIDVNSTGAKNIWYNTASYTGSGGNVGGVASRYIYYVYDGTYWVWLNAGNEADTTYSAMSVSEGTTGTATSSRTMRADYLKQIIDYHIRTADNLTPTADTPAAWSTALGQNGHYYTWYSASGKFTNQPSTYGFLESFKQGSDIYQRWHAQSSGPILYRSGNSSGWNNPSDGSWNTVATTSQVPTVNNATLTIQKNGTDVQTFTANSSSNKTANITVPTKTSDLTNDSNFVASGDLATVATSGSYNDLSNKPTIPTVNNGTLTIQKNGTTVNTFTANSSNNVTANIPVPTLSTTDTDPGEGSALAADTFLGVYDIAPTAIDGSRITNGTVTTNKLANSAVTAAKLDFSTFGVAATVNGPSSTTSKSNGATWASTDMYTGSVSLAAGTYLVVVTGSAVAFSAGGEQEWFNVTIDSTIVMTGPLAWFTGSVVGGNGVGIATIGTSGTHTVAYQLGAQGARTCTLYSGSKIQFVRIG